MEDKLKKFVQTHRDAFDSFEPRADLWQDISRELNRPPIRKVIPLYQRPVWRYAAAVVVLVSVGIGLFKYGQHTAQLSIAPPLAAIAPEMAEVENYYLSVINEKKRERSAFDLKKLGVEKDFSGEISKLDSSYVQLKKELYTNPNKQPVIDAMVQNLQIRIGILNQQLEVLSRVKQVKTENRHANVPI